MSVRPSPESTTGPLRGLRVVEFADSRVPPALMRLLEDKRLMVGVVAVTAGRVETPEQVAANIRAALRHVDVERLLPCSNCGMAPLPYEVALGKLRSLGAGAEKVRNSL